MEHVRQGHANNYGVYGVRKMWHALRRDGIAIGREQTARLMRPANFVRKGQRSRPCHHRHTEGP
ncbi:IS3 family transposase [Corynebacterium urogenitale]